MTKRNKNKSKSQKSRAREILGILIICSALILSFALFTHNPEDWPGSSKTYGELTQNRIGKLGSSLSHLIFESIGLTGYIVTLFFFVAGGVIFLHKSLKLLIHPFLFLVVTGLLLPIILSLSGLYVSFPGDNFGYGGVVGIYLQELMVFNLGIPGSLIISITAILVIVVITTSLKPSTLFDWGFASITYIMTAVTNLFTKKKEEEAGETEKPEGLPLAEAESPFLTGIEETPEPESAQPPAEPVIQYHRKPIPEKTAATTTEESEREPEETPEDRYSRVIERGGMVSENYVLPGPSLLDEPRFDVPPESPEEMRENAQRIVESLRHFNIESEVRQITPGPIVTRYELTLAPGVKVMRVVALADDLAMALKARGEIRILAPIPGKAAIGIEVPNKVRSIVYLREIVESEGFQTTNEPLAIAIGKTTSGEPVVADLSKMPHLLIAGATGAGKSVCIQTIIASILMKATPDRVRMMLVDPKVVELSVYSSIPHLLTQIITDTKNASSALRWAVREMENRYRQLASLGVRDIIQYNTKLASQEGNNELEEEIKPLPYIIVVIDEYADLMMIAANEIEESISRLAQMARAVGIHLILATQRPSADVITGLIKANFPSRIAFKVMQSSNSRIILDQNGADRLLGMGDMLFLQAGKPEPIRIHGAFISSEEIKRLVDFVSSQGTERKETPPEEMFEDENGDTENALGLRDPNVRDKLFYEAARLVVRNNQGSVSLLQRRLKIGYARAARLIDQLELAGIVSPYDGSKAREVLVDELYIDELETREL